mmetsp:Transcript_87602/g.157887  ORF Transcript_87602/g.157887 Transcript_87602/m.157887 type:complete len:215 (-) Transcript_87602:745-1389(-)
MGSRHWNEMCGGEMEPSLSLSQLREELQPSLLISGLVVALKSSRLRQSHLPRAAVEVDTHGIESPWNVNNEPTLNNLSVNNSCMSPTSDGHALACGLLSHPFACVRSPHVEVRPTVRPLAHHKVRRALEVREGRAEGLQPVLDVVLTRMSCSNAPWAVPIYVFSPPLPLSRAHVVIVMQGSLPNFFRPSSVFQCELGAQWGRQAVHGIWSPVAF